MNPKNHLMTWLVLTATICLGQSQQSVNHNLICWDSAGIITTLSYRVYEVVGIGSVGEYRNLLTNEKVVPTVGTIGECSVLSSINIINALDTIDTGCSNPDTSIYSMNGVVPEDRGVFVEKSVSFNRPDSSQMLYISHKDSLVTITTSNKRGTINARKDQINLNYLNTGIFYLDDTKAKFQDYRNFGFRSGIEYETDTRADWTDFTLITRKYFQDENDWGNQVAVTDNTMSGNGTPGDPLKVDTSVIATINFVNDQTATGISYAPLGGLEDDSGAALSRNNIKKGIPLQTVSQSDSTIILDNSEDGNKKYKLVPVHKLLNGRRFESVLVPGSGLSTLTLDANTNIVQVKGSGGSGKAVINLGAGSSDGDMRREVTVVADGLTASDGYIIQDNGVAIDTFDRKTSIVKCVHYGTGWEIYPAARPIETVASSGGGNSRQVVANTWVNEVWYYSYDYVPDGTAHRTDIFKGPQPGTEHQVRINAADSHATGDCVCLYSMGNSGSVLGFVFEGYTSSNVKNIDGNNTLTATSGPGPDPSLEITADNNSWMCVWHFGGQWFLKGTDE